VRTLNPYKYCWRLWCDRLQFMEISWERDVNQISTQNWLHCKSSGNNSHSHHNGIFPAASPRSLPSSLMWTRDGLVMNKAIVLAWATDSGCRRDLDYGYIAIKAVQWFYKVKKCMFRVMFINLFYIISSIFVYSVTQ